MYIVFEGIDNTGKSTQIQRVSSILPTKIKTPIKVIREKEIHFNKYTQNEIKILKYAIQRYKKHIHEIKPTSHDKIIISDRSYLSSMAYQGINKHQLQLVKEVNNDFPSPYMTFYFKTKNPPEELAQIQANYEKILPYNTKTITFKEHTKKQTTKYIVNQIIKEYTILKNTQQQDKHNNKKNNRQYLKYYNVRTQRS